MIAGTVSAIRKWAARRKALLAAVIRVVTKPALAYASGDQNVADAYGDLLGNGLAEALDLVAGDAEKKPSPSDADAAGLWQRLEEMAQTSSALLDKLEKMPELASLPPDLAAVEDHVRGLLRKNAALQADLSGISQALLEQALSIPRIEKKLEEVCHVVLQMRDVALEDFKKLLINSPLFKDWEEFHRADPDAVRLLNEADRHFLAGRRKEGMECLRRLFEMRGVGNATLAHHLGLHQMGNGDLAGARATMLALGDRADLPAQLRQTMIAASTFGRQGHVAVWRSLPRGFEINGKYRIEAEIGRGGMASVYRAVGIDDLNEGEKFAIKVPAPGLLRDKEMINRFGREVAIARKLSDGSPSQIVLTLQYEKFADPIDGGIVYALVMEFIDGENLARFLARRLTENRPLSRDEIVAILTPVCQALQLAHSRKEPVIHRDGKPSNVMLTRDLLAKLMDFGISKTLEEADSLTRTGQAVGTPDYMPPEMRHPKGVIDVRTDVYLLGCLLQEMMTFHPCGDVEGRRDLPGGWIDLVADATSRVRSKRPASATEFLERLVNAQQGLDQVAETNKRQRRGAEEQARELLGLGNCAEGLKVLRTLDEHRRPAKLVRELERAALLLPRVEALVKADKLRRWLRPTVEELAALCFQRDDLKRLLQRDELKPLGPGTVLQNSLGMKFAWIPPTAWYEAHFKRPYLMGSPDGVGQDNERPQHRVILTRGFWMAVTPATQAEWKRVFKANDTPSNFKGDDRPVEQVTWQEARDFCKRLKDLDAGQWGGFTPSYDLPTEAQWEYACRAGRTTQFFFGDSDSSLGDFAWFDANSGKQTQPVNTKKPNPWGLFHVLGNVWEWCFDVYERYPSGEIVDPRVDDKSDEKSRVLRGGSWSADAGHCRSAFRSSGAPGSRVGDFGFRPCFRLD
ncbi:MAG TPA: SUMF1/EgtB/PvdO family nonheme iron enzyme [Gemmataceae bacterium]|nr:SUMF1/EgtB/PvdO family nonheme iron enzyme [Gemmataceae bacterium]